MKKTAFISLILVSFALTGCSMFGGASASEEEKDPNVGHYLEELYEPTKIQAARLYPRKTGEHWTWYSAGGEARKTYTYAEDVDMGGVTFHNVYGFNSDTFLTTPPI